jgi:glutathione S-transferase
MLKIFGHPVSTCTRKVLFTLNELGTPFELVTVDIMVGAHKQESHLRQQPFGRIPALDDDGFEMFESRAMCRYLNERFGGKLVPADIKARAKMEQWISVETSEFTPNAMKFIYQYVFKREQEPAALEAAGKALELCTSILDKQLAKTPFLAGDALSLADISYAPYVEYAMGTPAKDIFAKNRHFAAWWSKVSERPAWRKTAGKA